MRFTTKRVEPGIVVLEMSGRFLMGQDCHQVDSEVEQHILRNEKSFIFDLSAVDHIDSGAVGQIVKSLTRLKKSGGTLRLAGVRGMVDGVLTMTQLNRVIEIFPTAAEAAKNFPPAQ
ncbi:MAG: STAS domain-containing protein [Candidatus Acidiferrales bacterium]|jgi:anti-anti-sigma factor